MEASASPLPGERDVNFRLAAGGGDYVLKFQTARRGPGRARARGRGARARRRAVPLAPRLIRTPAARRSVAPATGRSLLTWLPAAARGRSAAPRRGAARESRSCGRPARPGPRRLPHPAENRPLLWNMASASDVAAFVGLVAPERQAACGRSSRATRGDVAPQARAVAAPGDPQRRERAERPRRRRRRVSGLIDFGDARVEPPCVRARGRLRLRDAGRRTAGAGVVPVVAGYDDRGRLRPEELELLFDLIRLRLAMSVAMAA